MKRTKSATTDCATRPTATSDKRQATRPRPRPDRERERETHRRNGLALELLSRLEHLDGVGGQKQGQILVPLEQPTCSELLVELAAEKGLNLRTRVGGSTLGMCTVPLHGLHAPGVGHPQPKTRRQLDGIEVTGRNLNCVSRRPDSNSNSDSDRRRQTTTDDAASAKERTLISTSASPLRRRPLTTFVTPVHRAIPHPFLGQATRPRYLGSS